ncbi:hypothetical protein HanIR_Chr02g0092221 [Helianthus annuus]|nr:hypothetical protein HanIR_Chr02g0092221 [Helianthus annuus]
MFFGLGVNASPNKQVEAHVIRQLCLWQLLWATYLILIFRMMGDGWAPLNECMVILVWSH